MVVAVCSSSCLALTRECKKKFTHDAASNFFESSDHYESSRVVKVSRDVRPLVIPRKIHQNERNETEREPNVRFSSARR